jgi:hypothetical protein
MYDGQADGWKATAQLDARYVQRTLPGAPLLSGVGHLCDKPELGNATGHGASDHRASLDYVLKMGADVDTTRKNECQRPKAPLLGSLQNWLLGPESERYPTEVAFGLVRVDKVVLSFMPAELTVHAGAMVNDRVFADLTGSVGPGLQTRVVGLANSYIQYVTTPSEYAQQYYEAGSTLYGPASAEYMSDQAHILVQSMLGSSVPEVDLVRTIDPETAPERARLAQPTIRALAIQHRASEGLCRLPGPDVAVCFWWVDGSPGSVPIAQPPAQNLSWLQIVDSNGAPLRVPEPWPALGATRGGIDDPMGSIDDRGVDFFTTVRERDKTGNGYRWATVFKPSPTEWSAIRAPIRIRARASDGAGPVDSPLFVPTSMPLDCTPEQLPRCLILQ